LPFGKNDGFFVYLEGIEDPYNFGYTLRSLYAAGVDGVILSPRNWMEVAGIVARSSAGASEQLPIAIAEPAEAIAYMKGLGYTVVCAGIRDSVSMYDANLQFPILLVIGGEKRGISAALLAQSDCTVRIDYGRNFRGSLSAASAATVLAFEVLRQNTAQKATKE
jgi:23S rRNA (guanosine2251-2'-O)-methyltransferase